jgi:hypothetical protein
VIRYQTISKFSIESGYTEWAIRGKIRDGVWLEGRVWVRAPDGRILISIEGYNLWAEAGLACAPSVEARSKSPLPIAGVRCRERVRLKPTPANLKRAARHRAAVLDAIERNTFDYATTFPDAARRLLFLDRPGEAVGLTTYLDGWLTRMEVHLKRSTWDDYRKIINHTVIPALGKTLLAELKRQRSATGFPASPPATSVWPISSLCCAPLCRMRSMTA